MRTIVTLLILLLAPLAAMAEDRLQGTWQSDRAETMKFVDAHTVLEPRQRDFLEGALGRLQLTFDRASYRYNMPATSLKIEGKPFDLATTDETYKYRVLGKDNDSVAVLIKQYHEQDRILHIHFVAADLFWIYSEEGDFGLRDLNFREFFRRVE